MRIATLANAAVGHTRRWTDEFRARGHEVELWSLEDPPPGVRCHRLPRLPLPGFARYPLAAPALARDLARFAPDLVDAHYVPNYGLLGALVGRHPLVVAAWGSDLLLAAPRDPLQAVRARFVLRSADAVIADAENLAAAARAAGAEPAHVHAIPWGIDVARFRDLGRREPGLILSVRMHEPIYDLETVLRGAAPVLHRRPETRLAIAGRGSLTPALQRIAAAELPRDRVAWLAQLTPDAMAEWLARADLVISASRSDSTSVSLLEAMAAGAIPIVTDLDGNREWVEDGRGARLFPVGDATALAAVLDQALADPGWRGAARAINRGVIESRGDAAANMGRIEALYVELVAAHAGRRGLVAARARGGG